MPLGRPGRPGARGIDYPSPPRVLVVALCALGAVVLMAADYGDDPTGEPPLRVEALIREATTPLVVEYGVESGEGQDLAPVTLSARSADAGTFGPIALVAAESGAYTGVARFPASGAWIVTVTTRRSTVSFPENLPWPHYTTEAGSPKVKVDGADPSVEGSVIALGDSTIFAPASAGGANRAVIATVAVLSAAAMAIVVLVKRRRPREP